MSVTNLPSRLVNRFTQRSPGQQSALLHSQESAACCGGRHHGSEPPALITQETNTNNHTLRRHEVVAKVFLGCYKLQSVSILHFGRSRILIVDLRSQKRMIRSLLVLVAIWYKMWNMEYRLCVLCSVFCTIVILTILYSNDFK